jgi:hypothetical protein
MSEPLSSTEIEDVLSSIRRLVSDDMRPVARGPAAAPAVMVEASDKLILTPALRVVETRVETRIETGSGTRAEAVARPSPAPRLHLNFPTLPHEPRTVEINPEPASIETVVASLGAAVDASDDVWEAENGDDDIASLETVTPQRWRFGEDEAAYDEVAAPEAPVQVHAEVEEPLTEEAEVSFAGWSQTEGDFYDEDRGADVAEAAVSQAEIDPLWVDAAEASVIAALAEQAAEDETADPGYAEEEAEDEFRFNEDVLRELVRDILREELAGSMGERITRNIRKLVRTEIARSLAAQELS